MNLNLHDSSNKMTIRMKHDVMIKVQYIFIPIYFIALDMPCDTSCPLNLGRHFLRTVGAIIDMKEGVTKFQFAHKNFFEHFPRKKLKVSVNHARIHYGDPSKWVDPNT